jgi:hypothetical protein
MKLQPTKLAAACAIVGVVFYIGCAVLMTVLDQDGTSWFFNSILHGFDVTSILRMDVPLADALVGGVLTGLMAGFSGWLIAVLYNKLSQ